MEIYTNHEFQYSLCDIYGPACTGDFNWEGGDNYFYIEAILGGKVRDLGLIVYTTICYTCFPKCLILRPVKQK